MGYLLVWLLSDWEFMVLTSLTKYQTLVLLLVRRRVLYKVYCSWQLFRFLFSFVLASLLVLHESDGKFIKVSQECLCVAQV